MSLKTLSHSALLNHAQSLVASERKITTQILNTLEEIETRGLHLDRGYPSMFAFCTDYLGYSSSAAQRRISSMRLLKKFSSKSKQQVQTKIQSGALNLTHLSQVSQVVRQVGAADPKELLSRVENKNTRESEKQLLRAQSEMGVVPIAQKRAHFRAVSETETRVSVTLDQESLELLEKLKNLTAHQNPKGETSKTLHLALKMAVEAMEKKRTADSGRASAPGKAVERSRYIASPTRKAVWRRDKGICQFKDPKTKRRCGSRYGIEVDHIHAYSLGGGNELANLRLLCRAHNQNGGRKLGFPSTLQLKPNPRIKNNKSI